MSIIGSIFRCESCIKSEVTPTGTPINSPRTRSGSIHGSKGDLSSINNNLQTVIIHDCIEILQADGDAKQEIKEMFNHKYLIDRYLLPAIQTKILNKVRSTGTITVKNGKIISINEHLTSIIGNIDDNFTRIIAQFGDELTLNWLEYTAKKKMIFVEKLSFKEFYSVFISISNQDQVINITVHSFDKEDFENLVI